MRKCEVCGSDRATLYDEKKEQYACAKCHSDPDEFFTQEEIDALADDVLEEAATSDEPETTPSGSSPRA